MKPTDLMKSADIDGKCIVWLNGKHMPATFLAGMPFRYVMNLLPRIKPYKAKKKPAV